jgi:putative transposase
MMVPVMPFINVWIHYVWSTKERQPFLSPSIRVRVFAHIRENAFAKGIHLDFINGGIDHAHALVSLGADQTIAKIAQLLKGESSHWINAEGLVPAEFGWQSEYFAASVDPAGVNRVRNYIRDQEEHHRRKTYDEEYQEFIDTFGLTRIIGG